MTTLNSHVDSYNHIKNCRAQNAQISKDFEIPEKCEYLKKLARDELKFAVMHPRFRLAYKNSTEMGKELASIDLSSTS